MKVGARFVWPWFLRQYYQESLPDSYLRGKRFYCRVEIDPPCPLIAALAALALTLERIIKREKVQGVVKVWAWQRKQHGQKAYLVFTESRAFVLVTAQSLGHARNMVSAVTKEGIISCCRIEIQGISEMTRARSKRAVQAELPF